MVLDNFIGLCDVAVAAFGEELEVSYESYFWRFWILSKSTRAIEVIL